MYRQLHLALLYLVVAAMIRPAPPTAVAPEGPGAWTAITEAWPDADDPTHREARRQECRYWLAYLRYGMADPGTPCQEHPATPGEVYGFLKARLAELEAGPRTAVTHPTLRGLEGQVQRLLEHAEARLRERQADPGPAGFLARGWMGRPEAGDEELAAAVAEIRSYAEGFRSDAPGG